MNAGKWKKTANSLPSITQKISDRVLVFIIPEEQEMFSGQASWCSVGHALEQRQDCGDHVENFITYQVARQLMTKSSSGNHWCHMEDRHSLQTKQTCSFIETQLCSAIFPFQQPCAWRKPFIKLSFDFEKYKTPRTVVWGYTQISAHHCSWPWWLLLTSCSSIQCRGHWSHFYRQKEQWRTAILCSDRTLNPRFFGLSLPPPLLFTSINQAHQARFSIFAFIWLKTIGPVLSIKPHCFVPSYTQSNVGSALLRKQYLTQQLTHSYLP